MALKLHAASGSRGERSRGWFSNGGCAAPIALLAVLLLPATGLRAAEDRAGLDLFEKEIRPVLIAECYTCHNMKKARGGLVLDHRAGLLEGGKHGPAIVPGRPGESLLLRVLRHDAGEDLEMPKDGAPLKPEVIARFEEWIAMGASDPRDNPPSEEELTEAISWEATRDQRARWWSFQPIGRPEVPDATGAAASHHPVDRFIDVRLSEEGIPASPRADRRAVIRRLSFVLTGLPPTPGEVDAFVADTAPGAYARAVERLLGSPQFGECWARHWMDWMRYAETHGSEGDPQIPFAWRYRDYLVRALNADVPMDQLVREHIAGDLLPNPRMNPELGINESAIGVAQYRFVLHGFAPTDALDEQVRFTENQIDVISKAFLGQTVACARCHNHKFDPISQKDFYALYGVMASSRPAVITVNQSGRDDSRRAEIRKLKARLRKEMAAEWLRFAEAFPESLLEPEGRLREAIDIAAKQKDHPLNLWVRMAATEPGQWSESLAGMVSEIERAKANAVRWETQARTRDWSFEPEGTHEWFAHGSGTAGEVMRAGQFAVAMDGARIVEHILPAGVYSHLDSTRDSALLASPRFPVDRKFLYVLVAGDQGAAARYSVWHYPRKGTVYPVLNLNQSRWRWQRWDMTYWEGEKIHVELATAADQPVLARTGQERSWFGLRRVVMADEGDVPPNALSVEPLIPLARAVASSQPGNPEALAAAYGSALIRALKRWERNQCSDGEALFLDALIAGEVLPNSLELLSGVADTVGALREAEAGLEAPVRVPGVVEGTVVDQPLFVRGNHKQPDEPVERSFLEVFDDRPFSDSSSGRLELARDLTERENPLTARVLVNRVWHHLFGAGLVRTPDNFGRVGETPTHPELLDYLASRWMDEGWSLKELITWLVTSEAFRRASVPTQEARRKDPANRLWSHSRLQRLDAEAIRDALLHVSGELDLRRFGPSVEGGEPRRSLYVKVIRNRLDPFLSAFDAPVPVSTQGRRDDTNVPAQSLAMMNDPFVVARAHAWAERMLRRVEGGDQARIVAMFELALARTPDPEELKAVEGFLADRRAVYEREGKRLTELEAARSRLPASDPRRQVWADLAHSFFSFKEFIYLR